MAKGEPRTKRCTAATRSGRLAKARQFWEAAENEAALDDANEKSDACVQLWVLAGIAAGDVICCARLGKHAQGESHDDAVGLLASVSEVASKNLAVLLGMKTRSAYSDVGTSATDRKRAQRAAGALLEAATAL